VKYLLDTNVCIKLLNGDVVSVAQRLAQHDPEEICLCTIVQLELYYGAYRGTRTEQNLSKSYVSKSEKSWRLACKCQKIPALSEKPWNLATRLLFRQLS